MELIAEKREILGKKVKKIREERKIPGVIYGKNFESIPLTIDLNGFIKTFKEAGETTVVDLVFNGSKESVLIKDIDFHPVTSQITHVGFYKVDLTQKITAEVPVEIVGEEENELIKNGQALVLTLHTTVEVEALPTDLPHAFEVNVSGLAEIGDSITVSELKYDRDKVSVPGLEEDELIAKLDYAEIQEVEEEEEVSEEELIEGIEATEEGGKDDEESEGAEEASEETPSEE